MSDLISNIAKGAMAGSGFGPLGMAAGALLSGAPELLSLIGVHLGNETAAGKAIALVQSITGLANPQPSDVAGVSGDALVSLKVQLAQIAANSAAAARAAEVDELKAYLGDVAGARAQTVDLARAGSAVQWAPVTISAVVLITYGLVLYLTLTRSLPAGNEALLNVIVGTLTAMSTAVVSYWVGSSAGSAAKNALLADKGASR